MRSFLVLSALAVVTLARPEAGYSYNRPSSGGLTFQGGSSTLGVQGLQSGGGLISGGGGYRNQYQTSNQYSTGNLGNLGLGIGNGQSSQNFVGSNQFSSGGGSAGGLLITGAPAPSAGGGLLVATGGNNGFSSSGSSNFGGSTNYQSQFNTQQFVQQPQQALIQKHIYVHVPPPETEEFRQQQIIGQSVQPTKHYKIIFIKAPSPPAPSQAQILAQQQANEEKTLIYVLSKRPDDVQDITLPTAVPTQPSKPEVYFIKYKANKQNIQSGGGFISSGGLSSGISSGQINSGISSGQLSSGISSGQISSGNLGLISGGGLSGGSISSGSLGGGSFSSGISSGSISGGSLSGGNQVLTSSYGPPGKSGPY